MGMFEEENNPSTSNAGYEYTSHGGVPYMEVHALNFKDDDSTCNKLKQCMLQHALCFNESVQQPLLRFGQDEAIFKQYIMMLKIW